MSDFINIADSSFNPFESKSIDANNLNELTNKTRGVSAEGGKYIETFNDTTDWTVNNDVYSISISHDAHLVGRNFIPSVFILNNGSYIQSLSFPSDNLWISINTDGDFTLYSEVKFKGKIILSGTVDSMGGGSGGSSVTGIKGEKEEVYRPVRLLYDEEVNNEHNR